MKNKKHTSFEYIKLIFSIDKRLWFFLIFDVSTSLFYNLAPIGIVGYITNIYKNNPTTEGYKNILITLTIFTIFKLVLSAFNMVLRNELDGKSYRYINNWVAKKLYAKILEVDYDTYQSTDFLNIYQKAVDEASGYMHAVFWNVNTLLSGLVSILGIGVILSTVNPIVIIYSILIGVISYFISHLNAKLNHKLGEKNMQNVRERAYVKRTFYLKDSAIDVKTTDISLMYLDLNDEIGNRVLKNIDKYGIKTNSLMSLNIVLMRSIYAVALSFVAYASIQTRDIVMISALISASVSLSELISDISTSISSLKENIIHKKDYYRVMDQTSIIEKSGNITKLDDMQYLEFKNVSFKYNNSEKMSIDNINIKIHKNEKIAIVGENGAGKTTFIKLLLRLYDPTNGNIYYNDLEYKDIVPKCLRNKFVTVFQNYQIYALTVAENILLRKVENEEDEILVINALKKVGLYEKINSLDKGIHTICTKEFDKNGIEFSGGERQKLVIARIFATESNILVLDEPNSALDPLAEKNIFEEIFKYANNKTLIFISHRFSTTINADKIYLFDEGQIKESGTHKELMNMNAEYKRMFDIQAEKYRKEVISNDEKPQN